MAKEYLHEWLEAVAENKKIEYSQEAYEMMEDKFKEISDGWARLSAKEKEKLYDKLFSIAPEQRLND